jgi:hypothetical protein
MTDDRMSGLALIAGSAGMIITMAFHPRGPVGPGEVDSVVRNLIAVHSLALASLPVLFLGTWGLSRRLAAADRLAMAALVLYACASVVVMNAAVFDGLVAPNLIRKIVAATAETREGWRMLFNYNFQLNQAFARLYAVASSLAMVLWSAAILRGGALNRGLGIYGLVLGPTTVVGVFSGRLNPDVHGFGLIILAQALWFVVAGMLLCRTRDA